jgi:hypothetical protein
MTKRPVQSTEDFKLRIAAIIGDQRDRFVIECPAPSTTIFLL